MDTQETPAQTSAQTAGKAAGESAAPPVCYRYRERERHVGCTRVRKALSSPRRRFPAARALAVAPGLPTVE